MSNSFISGLGGLRSHQSWLDVIGNNLANSNTPGFKTSRTVFADMLSRTVRPGTGPGSSIGGTNPSQLGMGVMVGGIDRQFSQGALDTTGRTFDLAIVGKGFFGLQPPGNAAPVFSRVGTFGLDVNNNLTDLSTGYYVLDPASNPINVDVSSSLPPAATSTMSLTGNLPAEVTGPLAQVLTSSSNYVAGTKAGLSGSTTGSFTIPSGQTWTMELAANGSAPQTVAITGTGAPTTVQDVADAIRRR
jgi:flagellar hook protein FlgE